uniref:Uncharacterized protein n=1 Tax=Anguilla anguilla TaxID=7936 RepID=A0A0E9WLS8_ANGAN
MAGCCFVKAMEYSVVYISVLSAVRISHGLTQ